MGLDKERKPIPKWVHFCFWSGVTLFAFYVLFLICNQLWILSHRQNWSGEVNAAIINTFISAITLAVTIGVTVYFNLQTQKITIEQNQKNLELQMKLHEQNLDMQERINKQNMELQQKMQEMNYEAMMQQARSTLRDYVYQEKVKAYREILEKVAKLRDILGFADVKSIKSIQILYDDEYEYPKDEEIDNKANDLLNTVNYYEFFCSSILFKLFSKLKETLIAKEFPLSIPLLDTIKYIMHEELSIKRIEEDIANLNPKDYINYGEDILAYVTARLEFNKEFERKTMLRSLYRQLFGKDEDEFKKETGIDLFEAIIGDENEKKKLEERLKDDTRQIGPAEKRFLEHLEKVKPINKYFMEKDKARKQMWAQMWAQIRKNKKD